MVVLGSSKLDLALLFPEPKLRFLSMLKSSGGLTKLLRLLPATLVCVDVAVELALDLVTELVASNRERLVNAARISFVITLIWSGPSFKPLPILPYP